MPPPPPRSWPRLCPTLPLRPSSRSTRSRPASQSAEAEAAPDEPWQPEPLDELVAPEPLYALPTAPEPEFVEAVAVEPIVVEPVIEPASEPFEIAAAAAVDVVEQPAWSIVAPSEPPSDGVSISDHAITPVAPPAVPTDPAAEPTWPAQPAWPSVAPSTGLPFLGRHATPTGGVEALWAASDLAVSAPRAGAEKPTGGVQPCVSCGLSLSATARFCRRCGTAQVA